MALNSFFQIFSLCSVNVTYVQKKQYEGANMLLPLHRMVTDNAICSDVTQTEHIYIITIFDLYSSDRHRQ